MPVTLGRLSKDVDSRTARIIYWLINNQHDMDRDSMRLTVHIKLDSIKLEVSYWANDQSDRVA